MHTHSRTHTRRYNYEVANVKGLYVVGELMHSRDYGTASGGCTTHTHPHTRTHTHTHTHTHTRTHARTHARALAQTHPTHRSARLPAADGVAPVCA